MSIKGKTDRGLKRADGTAIVNLNADWETEKISVAEFSSYGVHIGWDNIAVTGIMQMQYSCQPAGVTGDIVLWTDKNIVTLDGTYLELLFLDTLLPITHIRLKFTYTAGAANMESYVTRKQ